MTTPATIAEAIDTTARNPASVSTDKATVTSKDISQLIEADRYTKANASGATAAISGFGLRFASMKPPGAG